MENLQHKKYISFDATVAMEHGLALRPATGLVNNYTRHDREVYVINTDFHKARHTSLSSALGILALNAEKGDVLKVFVEGDDEIAREIAGKVNEMITAESY